MDGGSVEGVKVRRGAGRLGAQAGWGMRDDRRAVPEDRDQLGEILSFAQRLQRKSATRQLATDIAGKPVSGI